MRSFLLLALLFACANASDEGTRATCSVTGDNLRPSRLELEAFCNDPEVKTTGNDILKKFTNKYTWSYSFIFNRCHVHNISIDGTEQVYRDADGNVEWLYVDGDISSGQPAPYRCVNYKFNTYALESSPNNNVVLQLECSRSGYWFYLYIQDLTGVTEENVKELEKKYGLDASNATTACESVDIPSS